MTSMQTHSLLADDDPEILEIMQKNYATRLQRSGLTGSYANARSDLGDRLCRMVDNNEGAYVWGKPGRGKTWAAAQAVKHVIDSTGFTSKTPARLVNTRQLLNEIKSGYDGGDNDVLSRAESIHLLVLDDLGAERPTDWAIETLGEVIDARTMAGLPTIVTSNYKIGDLAQVWGGMSGNRIASRLLGACESIEATGQDKRLKPQRS